MGGVTTGAALCFHGQVLEDKRSLFVGMAFDANRVTSGVIPNLPQRSRAMEIVAVGALHQPFVHAVVKGLGKVRLGGGMAAIAEARLALRQQMLRFLGVMGRVTIEAAHVIAGVRGPTEVRLTVGIAVAAQAARIGLLARQILELHDLGNVAPARDVLRSWPMTGFAAVPPFQRCFEVGRRLEILVVKIFMTGLASVGACVLRGRLYGCSASLAPSKNRRNHDPQKQQRDANSAGAYTFRSIVHK